MQMSQNFYFFRFPDYVDKLWYEQFLAILTLYIPVTLTLTVTYSAAITLGIIRSTVTVTCKLVKIFTFSEFLTMLTIFCINSFLLFHRCI